ncbi:hypothetical protein M885DRAFT_460234 [Pelagophyceae sp. CCMP2097]|nr:hypothetical protein M885DRAFT_460234 [Pelagophyceae sp. CCMP2097]|mmetsp:Transcript_20793/g.70471  ORF Transcript_20793/g.70471 Transcript_20793/m.70471 type:complete len:320 (-) Transcript_20793:123-1082(-)
MGRWALLCVLASAHAFAPVVPAPRRLRAARAANEYGADELLAAATQAAKQAGALMVSASLAGRAVEKSKSNSKDLLTKTDLACQDTIVETLLSQCPGTRVLGEEDVAPGAAAAKQAADAALSQPGQCWVVDPIDGTANFVDGIPLSSVSISAVSAGPEPTVLVGVVYDPFRDELFCAVRGGGAWVLRGKVRTDLAVSHADSLADSIIYAGAPPGPAALAPSLRGISAVAPRARTMRMLGSAALMLAYVAAGRGAAYFECDLAAWDTSAGALLITEAGGIVTDASGATYTPLTRQIVATNGKIHAELLVLLASVGGAQLD